MGFCLFRKQLVSSPSTRLDTSKPLRMATFEHFINLPLGIGTVSLTLGKPPEFRVVIVSPSFPHMDPSFQCRLGDLEVQGVLARGVGLPRTLFSALQK